jgi:hypothetical protein
MLTMPPAPPAPQDFKPFFDLLAVISDAKASKARLEQLVAAADDARTLIEQAKNAPAEILARLSEYEKTREKAEQDHARKLARATSVFDEKCALRMSEVAASEARAAEFESKAKADAEAAALLRADLQRRLNRIHEAAADMK